MSFSNDPPPAAVRRRGLPGPPPGPFRRDFWRSPLRGPWLTAALGAVLLVGLVVVIVTGLLSYAAYNPELGQNDITPTKGLFGFYLFDWPTSPVWLYALNQGLHVTVGIMLIPIVLAKLWSVIPKLFEWPPAASPAQALERASVALLVGAGLFTFATGVLNVQVYYPWKFSFYVGHLYGAWVFIGAFLAHLVIKLPLLPRAFRTRGVLKPLREDLAHTRPEPAGTRGLAPTAPAAPTLSRRGLFGVVGAGSLGLGLLTAGQSIGGPLRKTALLAPHGQDLGSGPQAFQINKTAASVGIGPAETGADWRLELVAGERRVSLSRPELQAMAQRTEELPIACVEGWSTSQRWTGISLRDLARQAGLEDPGTCFVESLQERGTFGRTTLSRDQVANPKSLLALQVNGADLSLDHGFPARIMVPAQPGVHQTKWVRRLTFQEA